MDVIEIHNESEINILQGRQDNFGNLKFKFSNDYIQSLKDNLHFKNSFQLFIKDGEKFCGYLSSYEHSSWSNYLYLSELFVDKHYHRQGIASRLLSEFLEKAKELNLEGVITQTEFENIPAQKLYEKMGFTKIDNNEWKEGITYGLVFNEERNGTPS